MRAQLAYEVRLERRLTRLEVLVFLLLMLEAGEAVGTVIFGSLLP